MEKDEFSRAEDLGTAMVAEVALIVILLVVLLLMSGCVTPVKVQEVKRVPPAAAMVEPLPLPVQTDPTLGGIFQGYVNAAQQYRACTGSLLELQEWVRRGQ